jgi:hypothetical protein
MQSAQEVSFSDELDVIAGYHWNGKNLLGCYEENIDIALYGPTAQPSQSERGRGLRS